MTAAEARRGPGIREKALRFNLALAVAVPLLLWVLALGFRVGGKLMPVAGVWEGNGEPAPVIEALALEPGRILAGGPAGLYLSTDQGVSWEEQLLGPGAPAVSAIAASEGRAVAAGPGGLWERGPEGWASLALPSEGEIRRLLIQQGELLAATDSGLLSRPIDGAQGWRRLWPAAAAEPGRVNALHAAGERLILGTEEGIVEMAGGAERRLGPREARVLGVDSGGGWVHIAMAEPRGGLARSALGSDRWERGRVASEYGATVLVDPRDPRRVYAGLGGLADGRRIAGVVLSEDHGVTWTPIRTRLSNTFVPVLALDPGSGVLYAGTNGGGLLRYREPTAIHRVLEAVDPFLGVADPLLLGLAALALLLQRRAPRRRGRAP